MRPWTYWGNSQTKAENLHGEQTFLTCDNVLSFMHHLKTREMKEAGEVTMTGHLSAKGSVPPSTKEAKRKNPLWSIPDSHKKLSLCLFQHFNVNVYLPVCRPQLVLRACKNKVLLEERHPVPLYCVGWLTSNHVMAAA